MKSFDEADHLRRAYLLTRGKIVLNTIHCEPESRFCQKGRSMSGGRVDSGLNDYLILRNEIVGGMHKETLDKQEEASRLRWSGKRIFFEAPGTGFYFPIIYLPQAVGLGMGEILGLSIEHSYYLSRLSNLLFTIGTLVLALRIFPGRPAVLAFLLIPMSLFQSAAASIDAFSTALAVLVLSAFVRLSHTSQIATIKQMTLISIAVFVIATSRVHLATMFLIPLILAWKAGTKKHWITFLATLTAFLLWTAISISTTSDFRVLRTEGTGSITLHYLTTPGDLLAVFHRTLTAPSFIEEMQRSFIGHSYGLRFSKPVYHAFTLMLLLITVASISFSRPSSSSTTARLSLALMAISSTFLAMLAMLLTFTPHPANVIDGIQGRYFLVPVIMIVLALCNWHPANRVRATIQSLLLIAILFFSVIVSTHYMIKSFYTPEQRGAMVKLQVSPQISESHTSIALPTLLTGIPANKEGNVKRIGVLLATWHQKLTGTAKLVLFNDNGEKVTREFNLEEVNDNHYLFFDVPPARYVTGRIELTSGAGGLGVWGLAHHGRDSSGWSACVRSETETGEVSTAIQGCP